MAYLVKEANAQLIKEIEHWLSLSEDNQVRLNELEATWVESGKLKIPPVVVDVDAAWNKLSGLMDAGEKVSDQDGEDKSSQQSEIIGKPGDQTEQTDPEQRPIVKMDAAPRGSSRIIMNLIRVAADGR